MSAVEGRGDAAAFTEFQRAAWSNLVLSVTQRCPLSCRHCITSSRNEADLPVLSEAQASRWAAELPELRRAGLLHLTFTGGEPTLARAAVRVLAASARTAGIATTIVTSGAFARSHGAAARTVAQFADVDHWDLGYDLYHAEHLPLPQFAAAVGAVRTAGKQVSVRVCRADDSPKSLAATEMLLRHLTASCGPDVPIITQSVRRLGRGAALSPAGSQDVQPVAPCPSSGPLVRDDGSVAPCCSGLAYPPRECVPFRFGNAVTDGLAAVWRAWREDQALRVMRLAGLVPVVGWLREEGVHTPDPVGDVCELCTRLWDPGGVAAATVVRRCDQPAVRDQLNLLEEHLYGGVWQPSDAR